MEPSLQKETQPNGTPIEIAPECLVRSATAGPGPQRPVAVDTPGVPCVGLPPGGRGEKLPPRNGETPGRTPAAYVGLPWPFFAPTARARLRRSRPGPPGPVQEHDRIRGPKPDLDGVTGPACSAHWISR